MGIQMLKLHWRAARWPMLPVLVAAFGLPLMAGQAAWGATYSVDSLASNGAFAVTDGAAVFGLTFPIVAAIAGAILGLSAWSWDHRQDHVYALSLPLPRWKYSALKFGGGTILVGATTLVFAAGATVSAVLANLPAGLHAYPGTLSVHFLIATQTAFALLFALASGTMRTTTVLLGCVIGLAVFGVPLLDFLGNFWAPIGEFDLGRFAYAVLLENDGPLSIFTGNWMLFDV
jgi:hypothetical protein